jgi:hypothetical protein
VNVPAVPLLVEAVVAERRRLALRRRRAEEARAEPSYDPPVAVAGGCPADLWDLALPAYGRAAGAA